MPLKFDTVGSCEDLVWFMRLTDVVRGENRALIDRLYNGHPPEREEDAEIAQHQVNRNFLEGTNIIVQANSRWKNSVLNQKNYFSVSLDSGPLYKRHDWAATITRHINRQLKQCPEMREQLVAEGAQAILHGPAPSSWKNRRWPIPETIPLSSLLIPSDTKCSFSNLEYKATFREYTPAQLWTLTHGPAVDPGWNMEAVAAAWKYAREVIQKDTNASALQYMPERWEDLAKQDLGYLGSDAVPTIDVWDFCFRERDDGQGWYRRIFLDWGVGVTKDSSKPESKNTSKEKGGFLYTSGNRKFADSLSEILVCQYANCSPVYPAKYHGVRSLGWMMWGICDILNQIRCRMTENTFMQMMWWFRVSGHNDFSRIKKAMFEHMGVIPAGIGMVTAQERFTPNAEFVTLQVTQLQNIMSQSSGGWTQGMGEIGNEEHATGTMAKVHSINALMGGMMGDVYEQSKPKWREISRRFCIKRSPYKMVRDFQLACLNDGVPVEMLDVDKWVIEPDRALGDGNKMLSGAIIQFLQGIRKNLGADAQRKVDHLSIVEVTDQPALAEDLAPVEGQKKLSSSTLSAQESSTRLLAGLPFQVSPEMVLEDYVLVWLHDLGTIIQQTQQTGGVPTQERLIGMSNMGNTIQQFIAEMDKNEDDHLKVKQYNDALTAMLNHIRGFAQRFQKQQQAGAQNGNGEAAAQQAKLQNTIITGKIKQQNMVQSHAIRTAQHQAQFEQQLANDERKANQEMRIEHAKAGHEILRDRAKAHGEIQTNRLRALMAPKPEPVGETSET